MSFQSCSVPLSMPKVSVFSSSVRQSQDLFMDGETSSQINSFFSCHAYLGITPTSDCLHFQHTAVFFCFLCPIVDCLYLFYIPVSSAFPSLLSHLLTHKLKISVLKYLRRLVGVCAPSISVTVILTTTRAPPSTNW